MLASTETVIRDCHEATEQDRMTFPQILGALQAAGVEGYLVDFRHATKVYYLPDGDSLELPFPSLDVAVAPAFDADVVKAAIREAQTQAPGYSYRGFCAKTMAAGCAGYLTSILGRRVVYFGRTGDSHVEHFPGQ